MDTIRKTQDTIEELRERGVLNEGDYLNLVNGMRDIYRQYEQHRSPVSDEVSFQPYPPQPQEMGYSKYFKTLLRTPENFDDDTFYEDLDKYLTNPNDKNALFTIDIYAKDGWIKNQLLWKDINMYALVFQLPSVRKNKLEEMIGQKNKMSILLNACSKKGTLDEILSLIIYSVGEKSLASTYYVKSRKNGHIITPRDDMSKYHRIEVILKSKTNKDTLPFEIYTNKTMLGKSCIQETLSFIGVVLYLLSFRERLLKPFYNDFPFETYYREGMGVCHTPLVLLKSGITANTREEKRSYCNHIMDINWCETFNGK
jgi:hypothetical protein